MVRQVAAAGLMVCAPLALIAVAQIAGEVPALASPGIPAPGAGWDFNDYATSYMSTGIQLTDNGYFEAGSAFYATPLSITSSLTVSFDVTMSGGSGADGVTVDLLDASQNSPTDYGNNGGGIGWNGLHGVGVALDTFNDSCGDPSNNFVGIVDSTQCGTNIDYHLQTSTAIPTLHGYTHSVSVTFTTGSSPSILASIDGTQVLNSSSLGSGIPSSAYLGFTGGSGAGNDYHYVTNVSVSGQYVTSPFGGPIEGSETWAGGSMSQACQTCQLSSGPAAEPGVASPINTATGDFYESYSDISVPGAGIPLAFSRTYDAKEAQTGVSSSMGFGWANDFGESLSYSSGTNTATVTEDNGAEITFSGTTSAAWCLSSYNFCPSAPRTIATLNHNSDSTWTFSRDLKGTQVYTFSSAGALTKVSDAAGNTLTASSESGGTGYCLSGSSCTVWTSSASGRAMTVQVSSGKLVEVDGYASSGSPAKATFCYYGQACAPSSGGLSGDLYSATDPGSLTTTYTYDTSNPYNAIYYHDMLTRTGPLSGAVLTNAYDSSGRVTTQTDPFGQVTTLSYSGTPSSASGGATTVTTYPQGLGMGKPSEQVVYNYVYGELTGTTAGAGSTVTTQSYGRDPVSALAASVVDGNGNTSTTGLDSYTSGGTELTGADALTQSDALGNTTQNAYTSLNEVWCSVDAADYANGVRCPSTQPTTPPSAGSGKSTTYAGATITYYDSAGNPTAATNALGYTAVTSYTSSGSGVPIELTFCTVDAYQYSVSGVTCPAYGSTRTGAATTTYDSSGDVSSQTNPTDGTTSYIYGNGTFPSLPTKVTDPDGTVTNNTYDSAGRLTQSVQSFGTYSATTINAYDSAGRLYCTIAPLAYSQGDTSCPTAPTSQPTAGTDPWPGVTITIFDMDNRPIYSVSPLGGVSQTAYDVAGEVYCTVSSADYALGITCPADTGSWTSGTTWTTFDAEGRTATVEDPLGDITTDSYDAAGNKTSQTVTPTQTTHDPAVTTDFQYDANNHQVATCTNADNLANYSPGFCGTTQMTAISCVGGTCLAGDSVGGVETVPGTLKDADGRNQITGMSCASTSFCVAVDNTGNALTYNGTNWASPTSIDGTSALTGVACASTSLCFATDGAGNVIKYNGTSWSSSDIDGSNSIDGVSCASTTLCFAVDGVGNALTYTGTWSAASSIDSTRKLTAISCASSSLCVATDASGYVVAYTGSWGSPQDIDGSNDITAISCLSGFTYCTAGDSVGNGLNTGDGSTWSSFPVDGTNGITAVGCTNYFGTCYMYDTAGNYALSISNSIYPPLYAIAPEFPLDKKSVQAYDPNGNVYCSIGANSLEQPSYQCPAWQATWISSVPSPTGLYSYTPSSTQANGVTMSFYDADGNLVQQTTPGMSAADNPTSTPDISTTATAYDAADRSYCTIDSTNVASYLSAHPSATYPYSCPTTAPTSPPTGTTTGYVTSIYDAAGRQTYATDQVGDTTSYTYNAAGDRTTMVDPRSKTTSYCYWYQNGSGACAASEGWTSPSTIDSTRALKSVSCPTVSFCAGVDGSGYITTYNGSSWTSPADKDGSTSINSVSCASASFCVAVDNTGHDLTYNGSSWTSATTIDSTRSLKSVSCPASSFCAAVDGSGYVLIYSGSWSSPSHKDGSNSINAVSCASSSFCVAVDSAGKELTYTGSWSSATSIDSSRVLKSVSCPTASFCAAVDASGYEVLYTGSWGTAADKDGSTAINAVSCQSANLCLAVDNTGHALSYNGSVWSSAADIDSSTALAAVSDPSPLFAVAADNAGHGLDFLGSGPASSLWLTTTPSTSADPSGEVTTNTYVPGGQTSASISPAGITTSGYDVMGDLASTGFSLTASGYSAPATLSFSFNQDGSRHTMTDGTGTTTYSYDKAGDQTQSAFVASLSGLANKTVAYSYDAAGQLGSITYPSFGTTSNPTVSYAYDGGGNMTAVTDWTGNEITFAPVVGSPGAVTQYNNVSTPNPSGTSGTIFYQDLSSRDISTTSTVTGSSLSQGSCTSGGTYTFVQNFSAGSNAVRNADGQVLQEIDGNNCNSGANAQRNYGYDQAGRVVYQGMASQGANPNTFAYDASGDLTTITTHDSSGNFNGFTQAFDNAGETTSQTPTGSHGSSATYSYDSLGDRTSAVVGSTTYTYGFNQAAQMTSYTVGSSTNSYYYTGDGLEGAFTPAGASSPNQLLWNTTGSLGLLLSDGTDYYIYGPNQTPVEQFNITTSPPTANPQFMTYTPDNSSWLITDTAGNALYYYRYDAFGTLSNGTGGSAFGYAGQYTDDTSSTNSGLVNMRARWYDGQSGAFSARDPAFSTTDSAYAYAGDDPINNLDPDGRYTVGLCGGAAAAIAVWRGWGGTVGGCVFENSTGFFGQVTSLSLSETVGYSFRGAAVGANGFLGVQISTASHPHDLTGWFQQWSVTAAVGPLGASVDAFWGRDRAGGIVFGANVGWAPGASAGVVHWRTYTWVQTWKLSFVEGAIAAPLWDTTRTLVHVPSSTEQQRLIEIAKETYAKSASCLD